MPTYTFRFTHDKISLNKWSVILHDRWLSMVISFRSVPADRSTMLFFCWISNSDWNILQKRKTKHVSSARLTSLWTNGKVCEILFNSSINFQFPFLKSVMEQTSWRSNVCTILWGWKGAIERRVRVMLRVWMCSQQSSIIDRYRETGTYKVILRRNELHVFPVS